jgi:hypothetical protein
MASSQHHQLSFFFPNLFQKHPVYNIFIYFCIYIFMLDIFLLPELMETKFAFRIFIQTKQFSTNVTF